MRYFIGLFFSGVRTQVRDARIPTVLAPTIRRLRGRHPPYRSRSPLGIAAAGVLAAAGACDAPPAASSPCPISPDLSPRLCRRVAALERPSHLPPPRGNAVANDENAALLGFAIFYDARFSSNASVRCATCHQPEAYFDDAKTLSTGVGRTTRSAPAVLNAAWNRWQFWDGRADSLRSQPL